METNAEAPGRIALCSLCPRSDPGASPCGPAWHALRPLPGSCDWQATSSMTGVTRSAGLTTPK